MIDTIAADDALPHRTYQPHARPMGVGQTVRSVWAHRDYMVTLARAELENRNHRTRLGVTWELLHPLLLSSIYLILLYVVAGSAPRSSVQTGQLILGVLVYTYAREAILDGGQALTRRRPLVLAATLPRAIYPGVSVISQLALLVPTLLVYVVIHVALGLPVGLFSVLLAPLVALATATTTGIAYFLAATSVQYRDAWPITSYILRYGMYLTPVLYTADEIPPPLDVAARFNPLFWVFDGIQSVVAGAVPAAAVWVWAVAWAVASSYLGIRAFNRLERSAGLWL